MLRAIDRLADAAGSGNPVRVEHRRLDARALAIMLIPAGEREPADWMDRCFACDVEIPHSLLQPDGRCDRCSEDAT